jgi:RHS repeat-associated protein
MGALLPFAVVLACGGDDAPARSKDPRAEARPIDTLPAGTIFYSANHQETPLALTNAEGEVVAERRVFPYGSVRTSHGESGEPYGFVGNELDAIELGISDFHARPYDARLGIFLAPDPIAVFEPEKTLELPLGLSAYAYAIGNPITFSDPTGLCPQCQGDDLSRRTQEMLRHKDPQVREAGRKLQQAQLDTLATMVPIPGGPAARLMARYAPKAYRLAQAARAGAAAKAAEARMAAGAMASKGLEKVKGLFGGGAKKAAGAAATPRSVGAAAAEGTFRAIAGTRGLEHSFSRHAAQWFGREVPASSHMARWQALIERAAGSGKQVAWSVGGEATVGHLARIEGKYFFAQFYQGGPRAGELATAFVPNQAQLSAILKAIP